MGCPEGGHFFSMRSLVPLRVVLFHLSKLYVIVKLMIFRKNYGSSGCLVAYLLFLLVISVVQDRQVVVVFLHLLGPLKKL